MLAELFPLIVLSNQIFGLLPDASENFNPDRQITTSKQKNSFMLRIFQIPFAKVRL